MAQPPDYPQPVMTKAQADEMIRLQRQANRQRGCLLAVIWTLLFGVYYWGWLALKWTAKGSIALIRLSWRWTLAFYKWLWRSSVAVGRLTYEGVRVATPWVQERSRAFTARYGAKGWYIVGGSVTAFVIIIILVSVITSHH